MPTLSFPDLVPNALEWQLVSNTQNFESPLNRTVQTLELAGARWAAALMFNNLTESQARVMIAFLARLRGASGRFYLHDHSLVDPRGIGTGTPLVKGVSQTGYTLNTDGWTVSQTGILLAGDMFSVNDEMKMVTVDADSDGAGDSTLTFEPPLRSSPDDNAVITVSNPTAIMRLIDDSQMSYKVGPAKFYNISINCIESFT